ncbi:hypothetical protein I302_103111 [Kwoniella bestiolae CBS 10118]|uniref:Uncharacterized protein n=1 Tax=Kwoniella bestiolae CBS 10118 TaxID=1296100 RepID=A0A1B9GGV4_9TREE|nr:hypothetical protein I302_01811 [Kwoniella bestiolae CBS 10118]OCF30292.1 hypothetical protein I302_01811 [Kwoniella bestiolae CBS 10118]
MASTLRPGSSKRKFLEDAPDATLLKRKKATGLDSPSSPSQDTSSTTVISNEQATSSFSTPPTIIPKFPTAWLEPNAVPTDYYRAITEYSHWPPLLFNFSSSSGVRQPSYFARFAFAKSIKFVFGHPLDSALVNPKSHLDGRSTPQPLVQAFNASAQGHELYTSQGYELNHEGGLDKRMYAELERPALTVLKDRFWKEAASHRSVDHTLSRVGVEGDCNWSNLDLQITTQQFCEIRSVASSDSKTVRKLEELRKEYNGPSLVDQKLPSHVSVVTEAQVWGDCKSKKREKIVLPRATPCGTGLFGAWVALALEDITNGKERIHEYHLVHEEGGEELNKKGLTRLGRGKLKETQVTVDLQEGETKELYEEEPEDEEDGLEVEE